MDERARTRVSRDCLVVGGGPAGMVLGLLLARAGLAVAILEKHADFLRDFRGDTVHPSTLQILDEIGLLERFNLLKQHRVQELKIAFGDRLQPFIEFRGLAPFDYVALVPQWDFLDLIADAGRKYPGFDLRVSTEAVGLVEEGGRICGVRARQGDEEFELRANVVVACDGRHSRMREAAGFTPIDYGAPMDVLWFRMPRRAGDPEDVFGRAAFGHMLVLLNRDDYWQAAYVVAKGQAATLRTQPIETFRSGIARLAPFLADRTRSIESWDTVKLLEVKVDRLPTWHRPGLLLIGDAAHAMSPVGGVGINLAVQDAVAAANALAPALRRGVPDESVLAAVERRRMLPTRLTQAVQRQIQKRVISRALESSGAQLELPAFVRWLLGFAAVRRIPARFMGYGVRREHVRIGEATPA
ncbi:MAG TPA: FAD-dependent oxidoreductase [Rudaea sp.]|nr:FAD-dependent oxidoreductase [Rudaea sp.]